MSASVVRVGLGGFALCGWIPFFFFVLSLAYTRADPVVAGLGHSLINNNNNLLLFIIIIFFILIGIRYYYYNFNEDGDEGSWQT